MDAILTAKMNGNPGEADWTRGGRSVLWIPAVNHLLSPLPATLATHTSANTIPPFNLSPHTYLPQSLPATRMGVGGLFLLLHRGNAL